MSFLKKIALTTTMLLSASCSVLRPHTQEIHIVTTEPSVEVKVNGEFFKTPVKLPLPRDRRNTIAGQAGPYEDYRIAIG